MTGGSAHRVGYRRALCAGLGHPCHGERRVWSTDSAALSRSTDGSASRRVLKRLYPSRNLERRLPSCSAKQCAVTQLAGNAESDEPASPSAPPGWLGGRCRGGAEELVQTG